MKNLSPETWSAISTLLDQAFDLAPEARAQWLERLRIEQPALAPAVCELLEAHAASETQELFKRLPEPPPASATPGLAAGERIGPYRLLRELGSGGMADVWLAERVDGAYKREVALKLPRVNRLRRDLAVRFARERDILSRLEHPHIARLYDAGITGDGSPYLAMECVDGQPIDAFCDREQLGIAARVRLFIDVLDAVQYAHARLVIHCDLKPSNILVTRDRQVRLLDFGIAKLLADDENTAQTMLTQLGTRALTPDYASPEQIKGEPLATASDIYSLGVVLFELLAGRRPYTIVKQSLAELEHAIVAVDPLRPSAGSAHAAVLARGTTGPRLLRALSGDLDTITLKALAKQPAQRYSSAAEFAADLRRHLDGQPVLARPATWRYRARRFVARNRLAVGAGGAVAATLVLASAVSLWQAHIAREQADAAAREAKRAEQVKDFMLSLFESTDPAYRTAPRSVPDLLKEARKRLDTTPVGDDATRVELLITLSSAASSQGDNAEAEAITEEAAKLATARLGDAHRMTADANLSYGHVLRVRGDSEGAMERFEAAAKTYRGEGDMGLLSSALRGLAGVYAHDGQLEKAIQFARESVVAAESQKPPVDWRLTMKAYMNLAALLPGKDSVEAARRAYELGRKLFADRGAGLLVEARVIYGTALARAGQENEGLVELRGALEQQLALYGPQHELVPFSVRDIGRVEAAIGATSAAIDSLRRAAQMHESGQDGKPDVYSALMRLDLAAVMLDGHQYAQAHDECATAAAVLEPIHGATHERVVRAKACMALALTGAGRLADADRLLGELREVKVSPEQTVAINSSLGVLRSAQGRHDEALELLQRAARFDWADDVHERLRGRALSRLGAALCDAGRGGQAVETLEQARATLQPSMQPGAPLLASIALDLARAYLATGAISKAILAANEAVTSWQAFDPNARDTGLALLWLARAQIGGGDRAAASNALRHAKEILGNRGGSDRALLERTERELMIARGPISEPRIAATAR
ncbi:MAG TPA: protein kinase [Burkholderiaceae bacterium]|nr:protein kinase [Burkholderiaceae bacterium]